MRIVSQLAVLYEKEGNEKKSKQYLTLKNKLENNAVTKLKQFDAGETAITKNNSAKANYQRACNLLVKAMHTIAWQLVHNGHPNEAEPYLRKTIEVELKAIELPFGGAESPGAMSLIGRIQWQRGDLMLADKTYAQLTSGLDQPAPRNDPAMLKLCLKEYADLKVDMGQIPEAIALQTKAAAIE